MTPGTSPTGPGASGNVLIVSGPDEAQWAGPIDVRPILVAERELMLALLTTLTPDQWDAPTECPAWSVKGIALHVLGDDLSLIARQRDAALASIPIEPTLPDWDHAPENLLDRFNERWVHAATFMSAPLIIELLTASGTATDDWYSTVDPGSVGEIVMLFGPDPAPYWAIAAREYLERWVHHLQIRRALDLGPAELAEVPFVTTAVQVVSRLFPKLFGFLGLPAATTISLRVGDHVASYRARRRRDLAAARGPRRATDGRGRSPAG